MVETLGQDSADVPPLQPMDSHFIYQAVNLKAPIAPLHRQPATDDAHQPDRSVTPELFTVRSSPSLNHTCIVFATDQLKG